MATKVLQIGKFHPVKGGVEKVMYAFMIGLARKGVQCDMLCASADGDVGRTEIGPLCTLYKTRTVLQKAATMISPDMVTTLRKICHSYDVIHVHHPDPMAALALFLSGYKGKVVLHWHSDILKQKILLQAYRPLQSWLIRRADLILGTSPVYVEQSPFLRHVQDKVSYLPIGVRARQPEDYQVAAIRNRYPGKKIVYSMGRLVPYKGYEYLIEAAKYLGDEYVVLIGGKGPLKAELQAQIEREGLQDRVRTLGYIEREEEAAYYGAADVFCLSSTMRTEAYAIVQVEAMSVGCPIVATNIPGSGVSWVNKNGVSGLNVPIKDAKALADAIQTICSDERAYEQYRLGAKLRYEKNFTLSAMIEDLIKIYDDLLTPGVEIETQYVMS